MPPIVQRLSDNEEHIAINWQTVKLCDTPQSLNRLARVVQGIEHHFPPENFYHWIADGSVTFRHRQVPEIEVRVWVDDDNELSDLLFSTLIPSIPIALGIDLTAHNIYNRHIVRQYLRSNYRHYCDPENAIRPVTTETARKVSILPDCDHWLDVVFLTEFPHETPIDVVRLKAIEHAIGDGSKSW